MLNDTFIQNKGITKTLIHENGKNSVSEIGWDADYDGKMANVSLGVNNNGQTGQYRFQLTNHDLEELLMVPSVNDTLDKRLLRDFKRKEFERRMRKKKQPLIIILEDTVPKIKAVSSSSRKRNKKLTRSKRYTHVSSPLPKQDLRLPVQKKTRRAKHPSSSSKKKTVRFLDF